MTHLEALPYALDAACLSPCRSARGVVIWDECGAGLVTGAFVISTGFNHQPKPMLCDQSDRCKATCGKTAVHAEQMAILGASRERLVGSSILHIKVKDGLPVASGGPSCLECSKLILEAGVAWVWLLDEKGWNRWPADAFHLETLRAKGIVVPWA